MREMREIKVERPYRVETFTRFGLRGRQFYFRICSTVNGQIVAVSEGYKNPAARDKMALQLIARLGTAIIVQLED